MHPRLFQFGHFIIPTYGVLIAVALLVYLVVSALAARLLSLDAGKIWNLGVVTALVSLAGAKCILAITHWADYGPYSLALDLATAPGAVIGGVLLGIAAGCLYAWRGGLALRRAADALAPALAAGGAIVWMARLEAGYAYGGISHGPLAILYTSPLAAHDVPLGVPVHPVQIYGALIDFALFVFLLILLRLPHRDGEVMGAWLFLDGITGFFLTWLRGDAWARTPVGGFLSGAQWVAVALVAAGGILWLRRESSHKDATVAEQEPAGL